MLGKHGVKLSTISKTRVNNKGKEKNEQRSSYKEHRADALAPRAEEGRGQLRKATVSRKQALTRGYPNGETRRL